MWHILLITIPLSLMNAIAQNKIGVEFQKVGRHINSNKVYRYNIYKKKNETNNITVTDNIDEMLQENINRLFNPLLGNKEKLLTYKSVIPKTCERYIFFTIKFGEKSNKIKVCESPYINNPIHKKITSWVNFLK